MHLKIIFKLDQDEDGYPPAGYEGVWARHEGENRFKIDNIPFFTREATTDDIVEAAEENGQLYYRATIKRSENSLLRVAYFEGTDPVALRENLKALGCSTEWDENHHLISVNVPPEVRLADVQAFLQRGSEQQYWDYEEPILRQ